MKTAIEIISKRFSHLKNAGNPVVEMELSDIIEMMNELADSRYSYSKELFANSLAELKPLADLWRSETNKSSYEVPDMPEFNKWITNKIASLRQEVERLRGEISISEEDLKKEMKFAVAYGLGFLSAKHNLPDLPEEELKRITGKYADGRFPEALATTHHGKGGTEG